MSLQTKSNQSFQNYVAHCEPLPWTITKDHPNSWLEDNHTLAINYIRFKLIMQLVERYFTKNDTIVDIGVYPGIVSQLFHEYYPSEIDFRYYGIGLGFDKKFVDKMNEYGVDLFECDLEPRLHLDSGRKTSIPLETDTADLVIFTDVIEHFYDPFYPLSEINRILKSKGLIILTTDNLTRFGSQLAIIRGRSCNVPLIEGNLFYDGDWRPHFREYSKGELSQLLKWAGFDILEHHYFEADFGQYQIIDNKLIKKSQMDYSIKEKLIDYVRKLSIKLFPHFRDNHILIARKVLPYEKMLTAAPSVVSDTDEWMIQRNKYS